jgi:hypothetical protein
LRQWRRRRRIKGREESYLARWRSGCGGRRAVVRPAVEAGFRWQSRKKEGEENLQERGQGLAIYALLLVRSSGDHW